MIRSPTIKLLMTALIICAIGISCIYASTYERESGFWQQVYLRQVIWIAVGVIFYLLLSRLPYRRLWDSAYLAYIASIALLLVVFALGVVRLGAQRWLKFGGIHFQPSEFAKLAVILALSRYFSRKTVRSMSTLPREANVGRSFLNPLVLTGIPVLLIIEQPDLGSGLLVLFLFLVMAFIAGVKLRYLFSFMAIAAGVSPLAWHSLKEYQKDRLLVFLNPSIDPLGAGYTVIQSRIAIGSGRLWGKGWLAGTQSQLHFLPEAHTDFIFSTFAEQWGLFGCIILLGLYAYLIRQGIRIGMRTSESFGKLLAFGITGMFAIQIAINIAMNMGFAPVVGIPLPFMSYGGSSLFMNFMALGVLANIARTRSSY